MNRLARGVLYIVCTGLSLPGGLLGLGLVLSFNDACSHSSLILGSAIGQAAQRVSECVTAHRWFVAELCTYLSAWIAYFLITLTWLADSKVPKWLPITGTACALFFYAPLFSQGIEYGLKLMLLSLLCAPAMVMAALATRFHLSGMRLPTRS